MYSCPLAKFNFGHTGVFSNTTHGHIYRNVIGYLVISLCGWKLSIQSQTGVPYHIVGCVTVQDIGSLLLNSIVLSYCPLSCLLDLSYLNLLLVKIQMSFNRMMLLFCVFLLRYGLFPKFFLVFFLSFLIFRSYFLTSPLFLIIYHFLSDIRCRCGPAVSTPVSHSHFCFVLVLSRAICCVIYFFNSLDLVVGDVNGEMKDELLVIRSELSITNPEGLEKS